MTKVIWLHTATVFWVGGGTISLSCSIYWVNEVRQTEIHTAEPLVHEPSVFEFEMAIEMLKGHKSPGINQIPAELIKAGYRTIRSEIHKRNISIWNKEELPEEWKQSIIVPIRKKAIKQTAVVTEEHHQFCQLRTKFF
jgi:hypothetical protein